MRKNQFAWLLMLFLAPVLGCEPKDKDGVPAKDAPKAENKDAHDDHDHADHGPHEGEIIELGSDKYHAEIGHDHDANTVTVWILDGTAKKSVALEAAEVQVEITHDGKPERFTLKESPDEGETAGKSSRFTSDDKELFEHVHDHAAVKVQITFKEDGKETQISGTHEAHEDEEDHAEEKKE